MRHFWVYMLEGADGSFYTGHTDNLELRVSQHQQGLMCEWTRRRGPVRLVWCDTVATREEAIANEQRIKGWLRAKKLALIRQDWVALNHWAKKPRERGELAPAPLVSTRDERVNGVFRTRDGLEAPFVPSENEGRCVRP